MNNEINLSKFLANHQDQLAKSEARLNHKLHAGLLHFEIHINALACNSLHTVQQFYTDKQIKQIWNVVSVAKNHIILQLCKRDHFLLLHCCVSICNHVVYDIKM